MPEFMKIMNLKPIFQQKNCEKTHFRFLFTTCSANSACFFICFISLDSPYIIISMSYSIHVLQNK